MLLNEVLPRINSRINELLNVASDYFGRTFPNPVVRYDLRGTTAGYAIPAKNQIRLNLTLLRENTEDFIHNTVGHELAHLITEIQFPKVSAHGPEWQRVMRVLGLTPTRCHNYDVTNARARIVPKKHTYYCKCRTHNLTSIKHRRILGGTHYQCRLCKSRLLSTPFHQPSNLVFK